MLRRDLLRNEPGFTRPRWPPEEASHVEKRYGGPWRFRSKLFPQDNKRSSQTMFSRIIHQPNTLLHSYVSTLSAKNCFRSSDLLLIESNLNCSRYMMRSNLPPSKLVVWGNRRERDLASNYVYRTWLDSSPIPGIALHVLQHGAMTRYTISTSTGSWLA